MAASIQPRGAKFQLRVTHKLLPRPFFFTFDERPQAEAYRDQLTALLAKGIVPQGLLAPPEGRRVEDPLVAEVISLYETLSTPAASDLPLLKLLRTDTAGLRVSGVTYDWVEGWVRRMKLQDNLAPGTIRKKVGCLARAVDWHHRRLKLAHAPVNPLRLLPRGYSQYTDAEGERVTPKVDETRDRRLLPDEEARVRRALAGEKRPDRERPLPVDPDFVRLFELILDTGLRLSEAFKLRIEQVDLERGVLRLEGSKAARGQRKPRVVPLKKHLRERLREQMGERVAGLLFPFWDGTPDDAKKASGRLSVRFLTLFAYAKVEDFTEHDLRHEATCRWFELRKPQGGWVFSDIEICRIMGWTSTRMALRYASLRGEDLADRLM